MDNELSHSVTACLPEDAKRVAHRDMAILFARHMGLSDQKRGQMPFDTEESHPELPFAMTLRSKHLAEYYPRVERVKRSL